MRYELQAKDADSPKLFSCILGVEPTIDTGYEFTATFADGKVLHAHGYDREEAFQVLRSHLDSINRVVLCNRYRKDAFVTPMARQMSDGHACYLVKYFRHLDVERMADCFGHAPARLVSTRAENEAFLNRWRRTLGKLLPTRMLILGCSIAYYYLRRTVSRREGWRPEAPGEGST